MSKTEWQMLKESLPVGSEVKAVVTAHMQFGLLLDVGDYGPGILERIQMARSGYRTPEDYPPVGGTVTGQVLGFRDWSQQIEIGVKPKRQGEKQVAEQEKTRIEVGLRLNEAYQLEFFGVDEVNEGICNGMVVKAVEKGRALMSKSTECTETVRVKFEGFSVVLVLEEATIQA